MEKIAANRQFANKLWNICKFVSENALKGADTDTLSSIAVDGPMCQDEFDSLSLPEKYIVSKCHELVESVTDEIEKYQLGSAGSKVRFQPPTIVSKQIILCDSYRRVSCVNVVDL